MTPPPLAGHSELQRRLRAAAARGRLPQSLLFHGPEGVGKQSLALWLARLVQCQLEAGDEDAPCGRCRSCHLALGLQHPDIHWFFPLPSPRGASTPRKRREKLEEMRLEELARRREQPLEPAEPDPAAALYLPIVEEIRLRASRRPAMGGSAVFVIGEADRMVPQASSPEAANAFLKLLEEPPEDTLLFLTTQRPGVLLPTIRSRVLAVRVAPPPAAEVADFLIERAGAEPETAERLARETEGSIGRALRRLADPSAAGREEAARLLAAADGPPAGRLAVAAELGAGGARRELPPLLDALETAIRDRLAAGTLDSRPAFEALEAVRSARRAVSRNANPQAIVAVLLEDLSAALGRAAAGRNRTRASV